MSRRHSRRRTSFQTGSNRIRFPSHEPKPDRKLLQLCAQVRDALAWVLGSVTDDENLAICSVESVEPLPGSNRLLVKIGVPTDLAMSEVAASLAAATPALRSEVAQSITRRKVPELVYLPVPAG